jgi:tetratricopeptide (TPR) repeat protein
MNGVRVRNNKNNSRLFFFICLFLIISILSVYWQVVGHDFINLDDDQYVTENYKIHSGLTWENIKWAFSSGHASNWHPLTWISHMIDCSLFGLDPAGHHAVNVILHIANTILLFVILNSMTNTLWQSAVIAALFALHPLHIESVAWIAERKDVLSTFLGLLTLFFYIKYVNKPDQKKYILVLIVFSLGLMAKPMLVTLPFVLLLIDYWPLKRFLTRKRNKQKDNHISRQIFLEKLPMLVLVVFSCIITFLVQKHGGAVQSLEHISFPSRIANSSVSYVKYILKMFWPMRLAIYYPFPKMGIPFWQITGSILILGVTTFFIFYRRNRFPYLFTGWFWYLGTLIPVIGIVQVGGQAIADRYTYIPLIGLFIAITWTVSQISIRWKNRKVLLKLLTTIIIGTLICITWLQLRVWKNSKTIFEHTLKVTSDNELAHNQLGLALMKEGHWEKALFHYNKAIEITPQYHNTYVNIGNIFKDQGKLEQADSHYRKALDLAPDNLIAKNNLGIIIAMQGKIDEAISLFREVLIIDPYNVRAYNNLGITMAMQGKFNKAIESFKKALAINPADESVRKNIYKVRKNQRMQRNLKD